ncbi:type II CRISPR RNA-guided endonuclease Cas9 [Oceanivirga salmonicida]|uniref:type II CRISPR RNA-guided endonuclease Cas9 n=1 Tax=Oceanivirga salmonicida TaxID=1769291 RepID=UPI0008306921|nr:type II CRISPR RNA-guided endonuclease Cas9 [Oceanivirga salmonicida]
MKIKQKFPNYYIGLDIGTNSVGWAVTDEKYNIFKFNGKRMWGSRLFDEAKTAAERRIFRNSRRRLKRRKYRLDLLNEIFENEISKIDKNFLQRLKESTLHLEDKSINEKYTLFNDKNFTDINFYEKYPTIYHLRKELVENTEKKDIRFIYLALHNILKKRGHFLFEGQNLTEIQEFESIFIKLSEYVYEKFGIELNLNLINEIEKILLDKKSGKLDKTREFKKIFDKNNQLISIFKLSIGSKVKLSDLYATDEYKEAEKKDISFDDSIYDEVKDIYFGILGEENITLLDICKAMYDFRILKNILHGSKYISESKVKEYETYKKDLKNLKYIMKKYYSRDDYNKLVKKSSIDELSEKTKSILEKIKNIDEEDKKIYENLLDRAKEQKILPKQKTNKNGVLPYQVHEVELEKILENQSKHYNFIKENKEKILSIFRFRIPYYVGPLNKNSDKAWFVRKSDGAIKPWNFSEKVDLEASAENFIKNLINNCTYLKNEKVIPKNSLLYEEYILLNELNKVKIDSNFLSVQDKENIINYLFKKENNVTLKKFKDFLVINNISSKDSVITGIDGKFNAKLSTYIKFKNILGNKIEEDRYVNMVEDVITWKCLYGKDLKLFMNKFNSKYSDLELSKEELNKIKNISIGTFGRLSRKLLSGLDFVNLETGEQYDSVIQALRKTNMNIMELMSKKFDLEKKIQILNSEFNKEKSYKELVDESYVSPSVKRAIIQSIRIIQEIVEITGKEPKKIFIETAREGNTGADKTKTIPRKEQILNIYESMYEANIDLQEQINDMKGKISEFDNNRLRQQKLYLYFMQLGKCMYSDEKIELSNLFDSNIYDIDHILPQSIIKDDSINNTVLVLKNINAKKTNEYPLDLDIQQKMKKYWKRLLDTNLISKIKYERLIRQNKLTDTELSGFIARQLVTTSQATNEVISILKNIYNKSDIVYAKAGNVSNFRSQYDIIKCRELNDFHHAKDAYLNIVCGNIFDTKFTKNPYIYMKKLKEKNDEFKYNMSKIYEREVKDIKNDNKIIWNDDIRENVLKIVDRNDVNVTRLSQIGSGELFDATIYKKGSPKGSGTEIQVNIPKNYSGNDENINEKYGYYKSLKNAYFLLINCEENGEKVKKIAKILIKEKNKFENSHDKFKYLEENKGIKNIKSIRKMKIGQKLIVDDFIYSIAFVSSNLIFKLNNEFSLLLDKKNTKILKNAINFLEKNKKDSDKYIVSFLKRDENKNKNEIYEEAIKRYDIEFNQLYKSICKKLASKIYINSKKPNLSIKYFNLIDIFEKIDLYNKAKFIVNIVKMLGTGSKGVVNMKEFEKIFNEYSKEKISFSAIEGIIQLSSSTLLKLDAYLLDESITGLFVKKTKI